MLSVAKSLALSLAKQDSASWIETRVRLFTPMVEYEAGQSHGKCHEPEGVLDMAAEGGSCT